jgi:hypothetical protein
MMFAQADLGQLPAGFLKDAMLLITAAVIIICLVVGAIVAVAMWTIERRRDLRELAEEGQPPQPVAIEQPLAVQKVFPAASVRELKEKHDDHGRRLDAHDKEFTSLWNHVRDEDKEIRQEMTSKFDSISRSLGRIEGKLEKDEGIH